MKIAAAIRSFDKIQWSNGILIDKEPLRSPTWIVLKTVLMTKRSSCGRRTAFLKMPQHYSRDNVCCTMP